jgi:hypothetical protein
MNDLLFIPVTTVDMYKYITAFVGHHQLFQVFFFGVLSVQWPVLTSGSNHTLLCAVSLI